MSNPFELTADEVAQVETESGQLIKADNSTATVYRPVVAGTGDFDGPHESDMTSVGTISLELILEPDSEILEPDSDAIGNAVAGSDVKKKDRITVTAGPTGTSGKRYRVQHARPFQIFGAKTFIRLQLKRDYGT